MARHWARTLSARPSTYWKTCACYDLLIVLRECLTTSSNNKKLKEQTNFVCIKGRLSPFGVHKKKKNLTLIIIQAFHESDDKVFPRNRRAGKKTSAFKCLCRWIACLSCPNLSRRSASNIQIPPTRLRGLYTQCACVSLIVFCFSPCEFFVLFFSFAGLLPIDGCAMTMAFASIFITSTRRRRQLPDDYY